MEGEVKRIGSIAVGVASIGIVLLALSAIGARAEPPIRSQQDAQCRDVARARVFSTPDPTNVGLHEIGRRIYASCMSGTVRTHGRRRNRVRRYRS